MIKRYILICVLLSAGLSASSAAFNEKPFDFEMLIQKGHSSEIWNISFSPDGKYVASASWDNTIKIWTVNGKLIRTIIEQGPVWGVSYSPDGKNLVSWTKGNLRLWDVNGNLVATITAPVVCMQPMFSPDGKHIACGTQDNALGLWDLDGKLVRTYKGHSQGITSVSFSPDGKWIATGARDRRICIWGIGGKLERTIDADPQFAASVRNLIVQFASDGKQLAAGLYPGPVFSPRSLFPTERSRSGSVKLWTIGGQLVRTFETPLNPCGFALSPDGKRIAIETINTTRNGPIELSEPKQIELLDIDGKNIATFPIEHASDPASRGVVFSPDSRHIASIPPNEMKDVHKVNIWSLDGGLEASLEGNSSGVTCVAVTRDGKYIASGTNNGKVNIWGMDGKLINTFPGDSRQIDTIAFSPDGKYVAAGSFGKVKLWDVKGQLIRTSTIAFTAESVAFSPDGRFIASGGGKGLMLWDMEGKLAAKFGGDGYALRSLAFSPDGEHIASGGWDGTIRLWGIENGSSTTIRDGGRVDSISFSPDGKYIVAAGNLGVNNALQSRIKLWHINGDLVKEFGGSSPLSRVDSVQFSPDGKSIVSADAHRITIWNLDGVPVKTFEGHHYTVSRVAFTPGGKHLVSGSYDGTVKLWNIENGNYFSLVSADNNTDWVIYTPDGYFDASPHGGELVTMSKGLTSYGIEQFAARNNRPDLILERVGIGSTEEISHYNLLYQKRLKKLGLTEAALFSELHAPKAQITGTKQASKFIEMSFSLSDDKYPLKKYNVFVNDVPLFGPYGRRISGSTYSGHETIELTAGKNKIELSAMNDAGAESYRALTYADYNGKEKGDLYYLAFGASKYKNPALDLNYADKDAKDLADAILPMHADYDNIHIRTFLNSEVTAENIKKAKELLKNARVDDTVILFIAGHGGYAKGKDPTYYFLPYEADLADLTATGVDFEKIEYILKNIPPRKKLFLMDTCESGSLDEDTYDQYYAMAKARGFKPRTFRKPINTARGAAPGRAYLYEKDRFIYNDLGRGSGAIVFSSSRGNEVSYESSAIRNGFFTREIINALITKAADKNGDGKISTDELKSFVADAVSKDTGGLQHPTVDRDSLYQKLELKSFAD